MLRAEQTFAKSPPSLSIKGVSKRYGNTIALDDVQLEISAGEFITLLGPSGSGKTTLLMILAGFVRPNAGSIMIGDDEITFTPPNKRNVGLVFQNFALFPHMDVFENIAFPLRQRRIERNEVARRVHDILSMVEMDKLADRAVERLSHGQKQRVALARALVFGPRVLLMDEPFSALDKKLREQMQIETRRLHKLLATTTISVTHDQKEAISMSDRIAVLNNGRIVQFDTPAKLCAQPKTRFVAEFIGDASFLPVDFVGDRICYRDRALNLDKATEAAGKVWLAVRPEKVAVLTERETAPLNVFDGTVKDVIYQGESFTCYVVLADGNSVTIRNYSHADILKKIPPVGQAIRIGLHPADVILVGDDP